MSSSICKAKLQYCTNTIFTDTAKFTADTDTGISIGASLVQTSAYCECAVHMQTQATPSMSSTNK